MIPATTHLMTVDEFSRLPEDDGPAYHELHHGEIVTLTRPKYSHYKIQRRLRRLLEDLAPADGLVDIEFPFRPADEHELWVADVAYVTAEQEKGIQSEGYLEGVPALVIEVLSSSNSAIDINEKEQLCLENGAKEFWVVIPKLKQVRVFTPDGVGRVWNSGQQILLPLLNGEVAVDAIFTSET